MGGWSSASSMAVMPTAQISHRWLYPPFFSTAATSGAILEIKQRLKISALKFGTTVFLLNIVNVQQSQNLEDKVLKTKSTLSKQTNKQTSNASTIKYHST